MRTYEQVQSLRSFVSACRTDGHNIGFVPTMGALHEGHLSLIRRARSECDRVVVSIFVNPMQFGPDDDYSSYPRNLDQDGSLVSATGIDALFVPSVDEIYPAGADTSVEPPAIARRWEGEARPGHFRGVCTVCAKLFNIVQPDFAYFGRKDYQQLKVIQRMVAGLCIPVSVVQCPTVREYDGLALSSRNAYLNPEERLAAPVLHRALQAAHALWSDGEHDAEALNRAMRTKLAEAPSVKLEYSTVADAESLEPLTTIDPPAVCMIAARIGATRLIDNILLGNGAERSSTSSS